jgi:putative modified peptide
MPFKLSAETVDTLLDRLSTDDGFRALFQASPRQALAAVGHQASAQACDSDAGVWICLSCEQLASKETIHASRDALRKQLLTSQGIYHPITLEVAKPGIARAHHAKAA